MDENYSRYVKVSPHNRKRESNSRKSEGDHVRRWIQSRVKAHRNTAINLERWKGFIKRCYNILKL